MRDRVREKEGRRLKMRDEERQGERERVKEIKDER